KLVQQSTACQTREIIWSQPVPFVRVLKTLILTFVPQQKSKAVGGLKSQADPQATTLLAAQASDGAAVSMAVTACVQEALWPRQLVTTQVRTSTGGQPLLVTVVEMTV